ncbi:MAG TPA: MFS transporter [Brumimicrobium sp.]|nr:MFS transporter [Brumimicrobium sp.]
MSGLKSNEESNKVQGTAFSILFMLSGAHFLNDALQMVIPAIYPILKEEYSLSFSQIGLITLSFQLTASIFQPLVGIYTDKKPQPFSLTIGMGMSLIGLLFLAFSTSFATVLISVSLIGLGSSVFHPESSRIARYASGGKPGMAQSIFQVGGNAGAAFGPVLAALIVVPFGQRYIATFSLLAFAGMFILFRVGKWFSEQGFKKKEVGRKTVPIVHNLSKNKVMGTVLILVILIFSKFFYMSVIKDYLTFYLIDKFSVSVQTSQLYLFVFMFSVAAGTMIGGPLGDKYGRKTVIWFSILGVAPFALAIPYVDLFWTIVFVAFSGLILSSAFPAIIVYGQELLPKNLGMVSGLFFGLAFGMGATGAALFGILADKTSIYYIYQVASFLPLLGLFAAFLPKIERKKESL